MKSRTVVIPQDVQQQIDEQVIFIAHDSIDNALAWEDRVLAAVKNLAQFHGHATDREMSADLGYSVRKLVFEGTYLIHYHVDEAAGIVRVVQFRHGMRQPTNPNE